MVSATPKVLFITGVRKSDLLNRQKKDTTVFEDLKNNVTYANIPSRLIKYNELGRTITARCWSCDHEYTGVEIFFPKVIDNDKFLAEGCFNSFKCLMSYVKLYYSNSLDEIESINKVNFLKRLLVERVPGLVASLEPALPKYVMSKYGGSMADEDYLALL